MREVRLQLKDISSEPCVCTLSSKSLATRPSRALTRKILSRNEAKESNDMVLRPVTVLGSRIKKISLQKIEGVESESGTINVKSKNTHQDLLRETKKRNRVNERKSERKYTQVKARKIKQNKSRFNINKMNKDRSDINDINTNLQHSKKLDNKISSNKTTSSSSLSIYTINKTIKHLASHPEHILKSYLYNLKLQKRNDIFKKPAPEEEIANHFIKTVDEKDGLKKTLQKSLKSVYILTPSVTKIPSPICSRSSRQFRYTAGYNKGICADKIRACNPKKMKPALKVSSSMYTSWKSSHRIITNKKHSGEDVFRGSQTIKKPQQIRKKRTKVHKPHVHNTTSQVINVVEKTKHIHSTSFLQKYYISDLSSYSNIDMTTRTCSKTTISSSDFLKYHRGNSQVLHEWKPNSCKKEKHVKLCYITKKRKYSASTTSLKSPHNELQKRKIYSKTMESHPFTKKYKNTKYNYMNTKNKAITLSSPSHIKFKSSASINPSGKNINKKFSKPSLKITHQSRIKEKGNNFGSVIKRCFLAHNFSKQKEFINAPKKKQNATKDVETTVELFKPKTILGTKSTGTNKNSSKNKIKSCDCKYGQQTAKRELKQCHDRYVSSDKSISYHHLGSKVRKSHNKTSNVKYQRTHRNIEITYSPSYEGERIKSNNRFRKVEVQKTLSKVDKTIHMTVSDVTIVNKKDKRIAKKDDSIKNRRSNNIGLSLSKSFCKLKLQTHDNSINHTNFDIRKKPDVIVQLVQFTKRKPSYESVHDVEDQHIKKKSVCEQNRNIKESFIALKDTHRCNFKRHESKINTKRCNQCQTDLSNKTDSVDYSGFEKNIENMRKDVSPTINNPAYLSNISVLQLHKQPVLKSYNDSIAVTQRFCTIKDIMNGLKSSINKCINSISFQNKRSSVVSSAVIKHKRNGSKETDIFNAKVDKLDHIMQPQKSSKVIFNCRQNSCQECFKKKKNYIPNPLEVNFLSIDASKKYKSMSTQTNLEIILGKKVLTERLSCPITYRSRQNILRKNTDDIEEIFQRPRISTSERSFKATQSRRTERKRRYKKKGTRASHGIRIKANIDSDLQNSTSSVVKILNKQYHTVRMSNSSSKTTFKKITTKNDHGDCLCHGRIRRKVKSEHKYNNIDKTKNKYRKCKDNQHNYFSGILNILHKFNIGPKCTNDNCRRLPPKSTVKSANKNSELKKLKFCTCYYCNYDLKSGSRKSNLQFHEKEGLNLKKVKATKTIRSSKGYHSINPQSMAKNNTTQHESSTNICTVHSFEKTSRPYKPKNCFTLRIGQTKQPTETINITFPVQENIQKGKHNVFKLKLQSKRNLKNNILNEGHPAKGQNLRKAKMNYKWTDPKVIFELLKMVKDAQAANTEHERTIWKNIKPQSKGNKTQAKQAPVMIQQDDETTMLDSDRKSLTTAPGKHNLNIPKSYRKLNNLCLKHPICSSYNDSRDKIEDIKILKPEFRTKQANGHSIFKLFNKFLTSLKTAKPASEPVIPFNGHAKVLGKEHIINEDNPSKCDANQNRYLKNISTKDTCDNLLPTISKSSGKIVFNIGNTVPKSYQVSQKYKQIRDEKGTISNVRCKNINHQKSIKTFDKCLCSKSSSFIRRYICKCGISKHHKTVNTKSCAKSIGTSYNSKVKSPGITMKLKLIKSCETKPSNLHVTDQCTGKKIVPQSNNKKTCETEISPLNCERRKSPGSTKRNEISNHNPTKTIKEKIYKLGKPNNHNKQLRTCPGPRSMDIKDRKIILDALKKQSERANNMTTKIIELDKIKISDICTKTGIKTKIRKCNRKQSPIKSVSPASKVKNKNSILKEINTIENILRSIIKKIKESGADTCKSTDDEIKTNNDKLFTILVDKESMNVINRDKVDCLLKPVNEVCPKKPSLLPKDMVIKIDETNIGSSAEFRQLINGRDKNRGSNLITATSSCNRTTTEKTKRKHTNKAPFNNAVKLFRFVCGRSTKKGIIPSSTTSICKAEHPKTKKAKKKCTKVTVKPPCLCKSDDGQAASRKVRSDKKLELLKKRQRQLLQLDEARKRKKRFEEYAKEDNRRYQREKHRHKRKLAEIEMCKNMPDGILCAESLADIAECGIKKARSAVRSTCRIARHPVDGIHIICDTVKNPVAAKGNITKCCKMCMTLQRVKRRFAAMKCVKCLVSTMESNQITNYMLHIADKDPKKRCKKIRHRRPPVDFQCSPLMASLKTKPCLWVYYLCPWFYPHCISLRNFWRQLTNVLLLVLAIGVWSPCILCAELCRVLMCCLLCSAR